MLYNLDHAEDIDQGVRVSSTIRFIPDIRVRVFLGGERLPDNRLQWALSHTGGISLKKQKHFSKETFVTLTVECRHSNSFD